MRDLIDKNTLRKELSKLPSEMEFVRKADVMTILGNQKCAYNIDRVVKQIEELKTIEIDFGITINALWRDYVIDVIKKDGLINDINSKMSIVNKK